MTKKYRHLLFDLDGTLTDPMEGITRSVQHALRHFGIEVSDLRELCPFIGPPFAESFRTFYGFDDRQTSEAVAVSREYFTEKGIFENRLYDGMDELLDTLTSSGYTLCVATSKPRVFAERILDHFGIAPYFSFVGGTGLDGSLPTKADVIAHVLAGSNITDRQIVHSLIKVASERKGNQVVFDPETTIGIVYGEADLSRGTGRIEALNDLFADTGLHYRATDVILTEIWSKFRLNVPNNQAQAMVGCGVGAYRDSEHVAFLRDRLREEVDRIAEKKGIDFDKADTSSTFGSKMRDRARYSTLQDLDAGRHTEVDMFAGAVVRMGRELGIPTPYNEFTYHMIKALEEKNDGKFDYE